MPKVEITDHMMEVVRRIARHHNAPDSRSRRACAQIGNAWSDWTESDVVQVAIDHYLEELDERGDSVKAEGRV